MDEKDIMLSWDSNKDFVIALIKRKASKSIEIEDILQEVFIKYWLKNHEIKDKSKVRGWLLSVSRFTIADYYRDKKTDLIHSYESSISIDNSTDINSDESRKLIPIICGLPPRYKNIVLLSEIYGIPHKLLSQQFDLTVSCVKTRVIRGRKLLAQKMKECCTFSYDKYGNIISCSEKRSYLECVRKFEKSDLKMPLSFLPNDY
jgi:RNA polymerase sigma-70 factor (ECF subfamily)